MYGAKSKGFLKKNDIGAKFLPKFMSFGKKKKLLFVKISDELVEIE